MRVLWSVAAFNLAAMLVAVPADACAMFAAMDLHDIRYADVVVVGEVANYEIVRDPVVRQRHRDELARFPELRKNLKGDADSFITDYARFDISVGEVLRGKAPGRLSVTWFNSTFGVPVAMAPGPMLIALRDPKSQMPPLRGPSATAVPNPAPTSLTVLQAPCAAPFMFGSTSKEAGVLRQMLAPQ